METHPEAAQLKIAKIVPCNARGRLYSNPRDFSHSVKMGFSRYRYTEPTAKEIYDYAMNALREAKAEDLKNHTANAPGLITNGLIAQQIKNFMVSVGMPSTYRVQDTKSRSRYKKYIDKVAGYIDDMHREIICNDGYDYNVSEYARLEKTYEEFYKAALAEEEAVKKKAELEQKAKDDERKANIEFATLIVRYNFPQDYDWSDVYDALLDKSKYLRLANAMLSVRNDWNDGPDRVDYALGKFNVETEEDDKIYECVSKVLSNWDNDGRVFRDCEYNYDYLFGKVDETLYKDYELANERAHPSGY